MPTRTKSHRDALVCKAAYLLVAGALSSALAFAQAGQTGVEKGPGTSKNDKIAEQIEKASQDDSLSIVFVEKLAKAKVVQAIPKLEEKFARMKVDPNKFPSSDAGDKAHVASALVRLGDTKDIYWKFLLKEATMAVESDAPNPTSRDPEGKFVVSPDFIAWVKACKLEHQGVFDEHQFDLPGLVLLLGMTGDPRAVPVFRRGLLSPNYMVEVESAMGLAQIGDAASVPFIIEACKKAPRDEASTLARSLVYFDDPEAQKAVDRYVPPDGARAYREERARQNKPFGN